jgi:glucose-1-phosphate thymidylyltransferase
MAEIVGIVPAAGQATRISPLPCSKELYPIALRRGQSGARPKVVSHYLFEHMRQAGIRKAYVILREGNGTSRRISMTAQRCSICTWLT